MVWELDDSTTACVAISTATVASPSMNPRPSPFRETNTSYLVLIPLSMFSHVMQVILLSQSSCPSFPHFTLPNFTTLVSMKIDATNYLLWKSQMELVLIYYDLIGSVDGFILCPHRLIAIAGKNAIPSLHHPAWVKIDQYFRTWITSTLFYQIHKEVHELHSSQESWQALAVRYTDQCTLNEMTLKLQFYGYSKKPN